MKQNKSAKRSLIFSVLSLLLCCAMLVGTTFAWFTDSVTSGNNKIVAGNLDVELYHSSATVTDEKVTENTLLFVQQLWEPGVAVFENFEVANEGTLALKYQLMVNFTNAVKTPSGKTLADVLKVGVVENGVSGDRDAVVGAVKTWEPLATFVLNGDLMATESDVYGIVIWWKPSDIDDEFNMKNENKNIVLTIDLGVSLIATQIDAESDSFGDDYDKDTTLPELTVEAEKLANELKAEDKEISIILTADVDLPISSLGQQTGGSGEYKVGGENTEKITIDLNGYKLNVTTTYWSSIGAKNPDAVFTIKNGTMTSSQATGTWNSYDLTFANCNYVVEDVVFDKAVAFTNTDKSVTMSNVTINETHDYYALWISARGQNVNIDGLTVNSDGRAIKIDEQYVDAPAKVTLNVSNATINSVKKAAITVKSAAGADIALSNVNIANTIDPLHAVWVDEDAAAYYDLVTVTGGEKANEAEVAISLADLQSKVNQASGEVYFEIVNDITGNLTVTQKPGVEITIDGNNKTFAGVITVDGKSATYTTAGLTIKNVNFDAKGIADASIKMGGTNATRYICNLTVENCTFVGNYPTEEKSAIKSYTGGDKNLTVIGCTATNMHSLVQVKNVTGLTVTDCTVSGGKNGISAGTSSDVNITGCNIEAIGYGIRLESNDSTVANPAIVIADCEIKAFIPVVMRNANYDASVTFNGTNTMTETNNEGLWFAIGIEEYGDVDKAGLTAASGKITVTLNGTGLVASGVYGAN